MHIIGTLVHFCVIGNSLEFPITQKKHPQKDAFCSLTTREIDVREKIRTPDTLVRSQVLYPAELHAHNSSIIANALMLVKCLVKNFAKKCLVKNFAKKMIEKFSLPL